MLLSLLSYFDGFYKRMLFPMDFGMQSFIIIILFFACHQTKNILALNVLRADI